MRYFRDNKNKYQCMIYEGGINEMVRTLTPTYELHARGRHECGGSWVEGDKPVLGTRYMQTWDDVLKMVSQPWQHGLEVVRKMIADLNKIKMPVPESIRRRPSYNMDGGDEVDYDRLRSGQEFWRKCEKIRSKAPPMITVWTDVTTSAYVNAEEILWRGAAALALTNILEDKGYRVELWSFQNVAMGFDNGDGCFTAVKLKDMGKPLNLNALVCGVGGWFYRTVMFTAYYEAKKAGSTTPTGGLGRPMGAIYPWQRELVSNEKEPVILANCWTMKAAVDQATKWIKKLVLGEKVPELDGVYNPVQYQSFGGFGGFGRRRRY